MYKPYLSLQMLYLPISSTYDTVASRNTMLTNLIYLLGLLQMLYIPDRIEQSRIDFTRFILLIKLLGSYIATRLLEDENRINRVKPRKPNR